MDDQDRQAVLARSWDEAADGYERYFVPRFAPWVDTAVRAVSDRSLPAGPVLVPCCGTFPELPALLADHPAREIVGIDLSAGMVKLARQRAADRADVRVIQGDAARLGPEWRATCAAIISVFGLQQLPDPEAAIGEWTAALRPGGWLSVVFWPSRNDEDGPFAAVDQVLEGHRPAGRAQAWEDQLAQVITATGAIVERDEDVAHPMEHPDAATYWTEATTGGSMRALAATRGEAFMDARREEFLRLAPSGPWRHRPRARWIVAHRPEQ